jgi:hypothetical protein
MAGEGEEMSEFDIFLGDDEGRLRIAQELYERFTEDLNHDGLIKARVRLVSGIQIAIRDAMQKRQRTPPLFHYKPLDKAKPPTP